MSNQALFLWINQACTAIPDWLWSCITVTGDTGVLFALLTPLLLRKPFLRTDSQKLITALFVTAIIGGVVSVALKETLQVARPAAVLAADQFHLIGHKLDVVSFPSGHTLSAFAVATLLVSVLTVPRTGKFAIFALASFIGLSRIAVAAHWPLDVLGGATIGSLCGYIGALIATRLHHFNWALSKPYALLQTLVLGMVCVHVTTIDMGYPDAIIWQYLAALLGLTFSLYSLLLLLKSANLNEKSK